LTRTPDRRNQSPKAKAKIRLKRVAKICNGKDLLIQMGNTFGENKRELSQAIQKSREKKVGERKLDLTKVKIAFQFPSVRQKLMVREMIRKRRVEGTT
jgi:hypothetical protein